MEIPDDAIAIVDGPFTNFGEVPVTIGRGIVLPTSEHLYQRAKFWASAIDEHTGLTVREAIDAAETPEEAKAIANRNRSREGWSDQRETMMRQIMRMKFKQHPELADDLLATEDRYIYEDADAYAPPDPDERTIAELRRWGIYRGEGQNLIGNILMDLRDELREYGSL